VQLDHLKPESDDPLHDSPQGHLTCHFGAKGRRVAAYADLAVVELCAHSRAGLTYDSDLVCVCAYQGAPQSLLFRRGRAAPRGWYVR
jgi:hypothetical protein